MNTKVNEGKLISGKDALIALANGEEVEFKDSVDKWENIKHYMGLSLFMFLDTPDWMKFRLKRRTVTINGIEVPVPFLPEEGELFYHASPEYEKGYAKSAAHEGNETTWQQFGAWRTEEEIKQVVAALRQVFGGSHE